MGSVNDATPPLKIAVLINGFETEYSPAVRASFISATTSAAQIAKLPTPTIDFYDPIVAQIHPDPSNYDLIVLSGGTADHKKPDPWVLKLRAYLQTTVREHPKQKLLGICWGHQALAISSGDSVEMMEGAEIGITQINLTTAGKKMFPFSNDGRLKIHEFHRREIRVPAEGFVSLAEGNQAFLNEANTILTFQGHPELNEGLAKIYLRNAPSYMGVGDAEKEGLARNMEESHDGVPIWARILEWVREE
jgi:GMP synthase-like glutamine amidotransferase